MKLKHNIVAVMLSIIIITLIGGCSSKNTDIQDDLINYINVEVPKIVSIENKVNDGYSSVSGTNYKDDKTMYDKMTNEVILDSLKLIDGAEAITPKTEEVRSAHETYISAVNAQHSAFSMLIAAVEEQDSNKVTSVNEKLNEARKSMRDYIASINELEEKYNVTVSDEK